VCSKNEIREEERDILLAAWYIRWRDGRNGAWTHKMGEKTSQRSHVTRYTGSHGTWVLQGLFAPEESCPLCSLPLLPASDRYCRTHHFLMRLLETNAVSSEQVHKYFK